MRLLMPHITYGSDRDLLKQEFVLLIKENFEFRTVNNQKNLFGPLLKCVVPTFKNVVDVYFTPYIGDKLFKFENLVSGPTENVQNNNLLALAQASGAGKTRLCFAIGSDPTTDFYSVFIRFCDISDQSTKRLIWLMRTIQDNLLNADKPADRSLHLFRMWVFAHIEWAMTVANSFNDVQQSREVCLRALQNGEVDRVIDLLNERWIDYSRLTLKEESNYLAGYHEELKKLMQGKNVLIFFDEVGHLKNQLSNLFINFDVSYDPTASADGRQDPDLYYGLRLVSFILFSHL